MSWMPGFLLTQPPLTTAAYLLVLFSLARAVVHYLDAWRTRALLAEQGRRLDRQVIHKIGPECRPGHPQNPAFLQNLRSNLHIGPVDHPTADVLRRICGSPGLLEDPSILPLWVAQAVEERLGPLRRRVHSNYEIAPLLGILGTILGLVLATAGYAETRDQGAMMGSVSMALGTTGIACLTVLVEGYTVRHLLDPLHRNLVEHGLEQGTRARLRLLAPADADSPEAKAPAPSVEGQAPGRLRLARSAT